MLGWVLNLGFAGGPVAAVIPDPIPSGNKRTLSFKNTNRNVASKAANRVLSVTNTGRKMK